MGRQPVQIAEDPAAHAEGAHRDHGARDGQDRRVLRRAGQQEPGDTQQGDAAAGGGGGGEHRQQQPAPHRPRQQEQPQQRARPHRGTRLGELRVPGCHSRAAHPVTSRPPGQHQPAPVQGQRPIRAVLPPHTVAHQDRRPPGHERLHHAQDLPGGDRVQMGGRLVEQQQRRVPQERPGDRDPLPLTRRQPQAPFPERGVVALRQLRDEPVGTRQPRRRGDRVPAGPGPPQPDVRRHRSRHEHRVLGNPGDLPPPAIHVDRAEREAAGLDPAAGRLDEPQHQRQQ